ncbi:GGDEF domain-containing protein [Caballeronia sordidicola]|uniref:GGDEF domain-containing protein n=1 Tax=Caballeronia sordidicola TaxID=196367 RepID=UPI0009E09B5E|nr:GGDEF domain-containing protein [Caballeronia sordidicola]
MNMPMHDESTSTAASSTQPLEEAEGQTVILSRLGDVTSRLFQSRPERARAYEIRRRLIFMLFGRASNVLMVGLASIMCGAVAFARRDDGFVLAMTILCSTLLLIRCEIIVSFKRLTQTDAWIDLEQSVLAFGVTAVGSSICWGVLTFYCLAYSHDPVIYLIMVVSNVATGGAVAVRNAALPRLARWQLLTSLVPVMAGSVLTDDKGYALLAVLVPLLIIGLFILVAETNRQLVELYESQLKLSLLSNIDHLTQIANRRCFGEHLKEAIAGCRASRQPLAILMIDVDFFKAFNDQYGHPVGDVCLQRVAAVLNANLRNANDLVARYGGEEFAVLLRNANQIDARVVAQQLCDAVVNAALPHGGRDDGIDVVTVSVGASSTTNLGEGPEAVIQAADDALYRSKRRGRNCVSL